MNFSVEHEGKTFGVGILTSSQNGNGIIFQMAILPLHKNKILGLLLLSTLLWYGFIVPLKNINDRPRYC